MAESEYINPESESHWSMTPQRGSGDIAVFGNGRVGSYYDEVVYPEYKLLVGEKGRAIDFHLVEIDGETYPTETSGTVAEGTKLIVVNVRDGILITEPAETKD